MLLVTRLCSRSFLKTAFIGAISFLFSLLCFCCSDDHLSLREGSKNSNDTLAFCFIGHPRPHSTIEPSALTRQALKKARDLNAELLIFGGDNIYGYNNSKYINAQWDSFLTEVEKTGLPYRVVPGNHDLGAWPTILRDYNSKILSRTKAGEISVMEAMRQTMIFRDGYAEFVERFGATYYSFVFRRNKFVVLNSISKESPSFITGKQRAFLEAELQDHMRYDNVFILIHHALWRKWKNPIGPWGSDASSRHWWEEIHKKLLVGKVSMVICGDKVIQPHSVDGIIYAGCALLCDRRPAPGIKPERLPRYILMVVARRNSPVPTFHLVCEVILPEIWWDGYLEPLSGVSLPKIINKEKVYVLENTAKFMLVNSDRKRRKVKISGTVRTIVDGKISLMFVTSKTSRVLMVKAVRKQDLVRLESPVFEVWGHGTTHIMLNFQGAHEQPFPLKLIGDFKVHHETSDRPFG